MSGRPLTEEEKAALVAVYDACGGDIHAHQPIQRIRGKFIKELRPHAKRIVEKLATRPERLIQKHTNREKTYSITLAGIQKLEDLGMISRRRGP